ncbi:putative F-box domain-containing protein [Rosa chinensis]|uniref:Putative F-box domain-containing protein n=2 Tax=Rosa chinensis TaxID=74649 RepID=A0A2P6QN00_ROSCH|nr:putative F-box domain-containing protein [Rosa chinensis]
MSGWERRSSEVPPSDKTPPIHSTSTKSTHVLKIDDLPDFLLVEILCRLPSKEFVFQCKCVSKHWLNLISDPYLIGRFLHLQRFHKQTPIAHSLIDRRGEEFPTPGTTQSSSNLLAPLFERLMGFHGLKEKPYIVGTCNDLVLCCQTRHDQDQLDFYICNPCTRKWIALPPTTRSRTNVPVGFICDRYYDEEDSTSGTNSTVNIKKDYRCKVVRILPHDLSKSFYDCASKFIVEVFSFETGEWRESIVSSPRSINIGDTSVAYNGMLYWTYTAYEPREETGLIRLDPFMLDNGSAGSGRPNGDVTGDDDQYKFYIFDAVDKFLERP